MTIIIYENFNHPVLTRGKTQIFPQIIKGDTFADCCIQIYKLERSARYNNYLHYSFEDREIEKNYHEWKKDGVTFDLYYGNATVD